MKLARKYAVFVILAALLSACSALQTSPEQQIRDGANGITATATVATALLRVDKISKAQAQSYVSVLKTVDGHLNVTFKALEACRAKTGSTPKTTPDPCRASVQSDIDLAVKTATDLRKILDAK